MSEVAEREMRDEVVEVMDTPEKSKSAQIATSVNKFEESPVFNFLNSLSPIKPVKALYITQTVNPLNFASLPSVFTSPQVTSFRESRFLQRHQLLADPSKPEFSSFDENKDDGDETNKDAGKKENLDPRMSDSEVAVKPSYDSSMFLVDSAQDYDSSLNHSSGLKPKYTSDHGCDSTVLVRDPLQRASYGCEANMNEGGYHNDQNKEGDRESLIDASDLLIFQSPPNFEDSRKKSLDQGETFYASIENDMQQMPSQFALASDEQVKAGNEPENLCTQPGETNDVLENAENNEGLNNPGEKRDYEHLPGFYRGTRRRCLVFEMAGARMKHLNQSTANSSSPMLSQSEGSSNITNEQQLVLTKSGNDSSQHVLPGIGLHLNAIASTPNDYKIVNQDSSSASGRLLIGPSSSFNFGSSSGTTGQELLRNVVPVENSILTVEDTQQANAFVVNEEVNLSSPKKKRRHEQAGEAESCKRCNCKKSKCLKLYCECFAAGVYCVEPCACIDCFNKPIHEDTVIATRKQIESRNPLAFAPKVIRGSDPLSENGDDAARTPASARHKRGCNCKKSGCLKKYCECYQGGVGCSINCRCEGCKNAFGRKDGSGVIGIELQAEEDKTDKNEMDHQNIDSTTPATPLRQLIPQPFSSKNKPPRSSSFASTISSSSSSSSSFFMNPGYKFDEHFEAIREEDEIPDFLQENSPINGIKSLSSPNGKRVSPPRNGGMSPGLRSSRKLILQSIPSFPSLTSKQ